MLEWIWFSVLLAVLVGLIAWDSYHDFTGGEASMARIMISILCFVGCLAVKSDLFVEQPYHWLLNVLPEADTTINLVTVLFLTGCLLLAYLSGIVLGTYFAVKRWAHMKASGPEAVR